jgi:hypothetical protein
MNGFNSGDKIGIRYSEYSFCSWEGGGSIHRSVVSLCFLLVLTPYAFHFSVLGDSKAQPFAACPSPTQYLLINPSISNFLLLPTQRLLPLLNHIRIHLIRSCASPRQPHSSSHFPHPPQQNGREELTRHIQPQTHPKHARQHPTPLSRRSYRAIHQPRLRAHAHGIQRIKHRIPVTRQLFPPTSHFNLVKGC